MIFQYQLFLYLRVVAIDGGEKAPGVWLVELPALEPAFVIITRIANVAKR